MPHNDVITGSADVFREPDRLGTVRYNFRITPDGQVSGWIVVTDLDPAAGAVPAIFLPRGPLTGHDLTLILPGGRRVGFTVPATDGTIANGRLTHIET